MSDTLIAPKLDRKAAREVLQQYVELMDLLRHVERRMTRLAPRLDKPSGHTYRTFYDASTAWRARTDNVRTLYDEVERLAVAINLQAL